MTNTESNSSRSEKLIDFTVLCAWLITSITMAVIAYSQFGQDFRGYYAAARVLLEGGNPYNYSKVAPILMEITGRVGNNPFYYPLWFGWFITPLTWIPFQPARALWMLFNLAAWIFGLIRLQELIHWPREGWQTWSMNLLATFLFAWTTWKFEQTGILLFVITVETLIAYRKKQFNRMGIYLAAALIKPNIMLVPVTILALWLIRNKIFRPVIVMSALLVGLVILTTILTPDWYQPILQPNFGQGLTEVLDGPNKTTGIRLNTTMLDWLKMFQVPEVMRNILYGFAVSIGLIVVVRALWKSKSFMEITVISLLVNFAVTPYALQYDFPPLAICMFWALAESSQTGPQKIPMIITSFTASVLFWERPISDGYWIVVGLCLLVVWSKKTNRNMQLPDNLL
jgi:hypothetical protein